MNQYAFHGHSGLPYKHEQQPLTPISTLTSHYPQDSPAQSHVLPPLHPPPAASSSSSFASQNYARPPNSHTPRLPHTPDTPGMPEQQQQQQPPPSLGSHPTHMPAAEPHTSYPPINHGFPASHQLPHYAPPPAQQQVTMPSASTAQYSLPQIGMDYRQQQQQQQPPQQPQPQPQHHQQHGLPPYQYPSQHQQIQQPQNPAQQPQDRRPLPVVGSQGRRGILPSAAGRAPPPGSAPDGSMRASAPAHRNSENKYPCHYCNKTYLHLKHLKRHHLRHTGERPYQCGLCHETFCRSDILKRHFNKCSLRRGNPTGATHLTHAQDHLKANLPPAPAPSGIATNGGFSHPRPSAISTTASVNPPSSYQQWPGSARSFEGYNNFGQQAQMHPHNVGGSTRSSRSSSIIRPESSSDEDGKKRFSSTSTLPTAVGTAETSPSAGAQSFTFSTDRSAMHHQRDGSSSTYYSSAPNSAQMPPMAQQQGEHLPPVNYLRGGFQQYQQPNAEHMYQQNWNSAFQPGASDQLMYSGH